MRTENMLSNYRVLDLADEKGFFCGKILRDLGADVIKIEKPGGDPSRRIGPFYHDIPHPEKSLYWFCNNISKRGITLNIETEDGKEIFKRLVKSADFVIESFPPGYMDGSGLGYPSLSELNPGIIMASITPFGQTGPYRDYKGSDIVAMATGGLMNLCGDADRAPLRCTIDQSYSHASFQAAIGLLFALYYRHLIGEGQHVDVSIQESVLPTSWNSQQWWELSKVTIKRQGVRLARGATAPRNVFPCKDGYVCWRIFTGEHEPKQRAIVDWMDEEGMAGDLKEVKWEEIDMDKVGQGQLEHWEELTSKFFVTHSKEELYEGAFRRGGMLFPVNNVKDILENKQLAARDFWVEVEHPELGTAISYPGAPFKSNETAWRISRRAPLIGEHNEEIYEKELKISKEELAILKQANVI